MRTGCSETSSTATPHPSFSDIPGSQRERVSRSEGGVLERRSSCRAVLEKARGPVCFETAALAIEAASVRFKFNIMLYVVIAASLIGLKYLFLNRA